MVGDLSVVQAAHEEMRALFAVVKAARHAFEIHTWETPRAKRDAMQAIGSALQELHDARAAQVQGADK